ncbi:MAG: DNA polymerase III subunit alpha [Bacteroidales bacterium]|nr:DNA polymerase III subunit alpha [Bacteroidales bacterium]
MFLIFDTETTGLPKNDNAPLTDFDNWPRMVQLAWQIHDEKGRFVENHNYLVQPDGFVIPIDAKMVHGISTEHAMKYGKPLNEVLDLFMISAAKAKYLVGHNINFDLNVLGCEFLRCGRENPLRRWQIIDTCTEKTAEFCQFPGGKGGKFKLPRLGEFHHLLFGEDFDSAHNASADVEATARVFLELIRRGVLDETDLHVDAQFIDDFKAANPDVIQPAGIKVEANFDEEEKVEEEPGMGDYIPQHFTHLHVHSHYSMLDGMSKVPDLVAKCKKYGMYSLALTDHGNMFGIKDFADTVNKENGKVKDAIKEQQAIIGKPESTEEEKIAAQQQIEKLNKQFFKPIFGIETYCAPISIDKRDGRQDRGWHLILLAKNKTGYHSLCKLSSIAYTEGFYYNPRIDHSLLEKYHDGLICSSACLAGEVPQKIMNGDMKGAEESIQWFKNLFGDDYYLEVQRHKTDKPGGDTEVYERQKEVNKIIFDLAKKYNVKVIATNDVHFVEEEHGEAHDRLICLSTGKDLDDPTRMHYTKQEWLKTPEEMGRIFSDHPEVLENTQEIVGKVETYSIDSDPIMPKFPIPEDFGTEEEYRKKFTEEDLFNEFTRDEHGNVVMSQEEAEKKVKKLGGYDRLYRIKLEADYLAKLTWEGAKERYGENLTEDQIERIKFELHVMKTMGFPGYFLIVSDYIRAAREELGVSVGPGRGSAAGSVVAYCLKITDLDPLKYDLLFERFLNPDRISLPDIDVDFDDDGRERVLNWVTNKYGKEKVAHIITYGTMAAKSAIQDVGRVQKVPLPEVAKIKSFIPDRNFDEAQVKAVEGEVPKKMPKVNLKNCYKYVPELKEMLEGDDKNVSSMLTYAEELEDTNRQIGIHACGVIIGADDLTNVAPVCTVRDKDTKEDVVVTQYDGHVIETVGLIKMDFLGLKTLTLIKDALKNIKKTHGIDIDIDHIPIDDEETYKLYSAGNTIGTFQFESPGMQKYLRELQPSVIGDIIAMNALYRPGPMDNIPDFIARKQGRQEIKYDFECMKKYLQDTYGICVYQEQVMLLSRELADFTRGESDTLRKAMGKKQLAKMEELYEKFMKQGVAKLTKTENLPEEEVKKRLEKIWEEWKKFASYAFNKSHAACYSWVSYQTAYLKAHYPAEFMAAVLNNELGDIKQVNFMTEECKRMKIAVLGPDVNESEYEFSVNEKGEIRYGMGGIKNVGEAAVAGIVAEREANGKFKDFGDFVMRVADKGLNVRALESMGMAGCFDSFKGFHRAMLFYIAPNETSSFSEKAMRMVASYNERKNSSQMDLFGFGGDEMEETFTMPLPVCEPWSKMKELEMEKEALGFYISSHPMEVYHLPLRYFANCNVETLKAAMNDPEKNIRRAVHLGGQITKAEEYTAKNGNPYGRFTIEDQSGALQFSLFRENYLNCRNLLTVNSFVLLNGTLDKPYPRAGQDPNLMPQTLEVRFTEARLLDSLLETTSKTVYLKLNVSEMNESDMKEFVKTMKANPGKQNYKIHLYDPINKKSCNLTPYRGAVNAQELLPLLEKMSFVEFDLK